MSEELYKVLLDDVFEGPMDLLIHLIKKNEVDIYDIPISLITNQYLGYLKLMKSLNIDLAGDFILMAAILAHIKSKMLLPVHEGEDEEDPRIEIAMPILEYLEMKSVAEQLAERNLLGDSTFIRRSDIKDFLSDQDDKVITVGLFELIDAFQKILKNISEDQRINITADKMSVKDKISRLVDIFEDKGSISFEELFSANVLKSDVILTFLAILEMVKLCLVRIAQHTQSGVIRLFYI
ncbi:MAG: segregation/condensation protein A [Deltaproteobacteria bacterium]|nr:segregation/condensation protein A [Deltaproteobacteria bacterium]